MPDPRAKRIACNEVEFRDINERLEADLRGLGDDAELHAFVCECGNTDCRETVALSFAEYEGVRADPMTFFVVPGHEIPDVETVEDSSDRYAVVRKLEPTRPIAEGADPRS